MHITNLHWVEGFKFRFEFNDGRKGFVDLFAQDLFKPGMGLALSDFVITDKGLDWSEGLLISNESIRARLTPT